MVHSCGEVEVDQLHSLVSLLQSHLVEPLVQTCSASLLMMEDLEDLVDPEVSLVVVPEVLELLVHSCLELEVQSYSLMVLEVLQLEAPEVVEDLLAGMKDLEDPS